LTHSSLNVAALPLRTEKRRTHPVLDALDEIVAILTTPETLVANLAKALDLLDAELDLRDGRVALLDPEGRLTAVAGSGAGQPPETPTPVLKNLLGAGTPAAIRLGRKKTSLLAAPVWFDGKIIGLLTVHRPRQSRYARRLDENLRLLSLVANLIGPSLFASRHPAPEANRGKAPEKPEARKIVGESAVLKSALAQARRVAPTNLSVLLRGESGSGKELFAQLIHDLSPRREKPFIKVNCAALPEGVLESELFGHERGAFTGAVAERKGRFELADGGTLLLDEIGDIPLSFQAKLLRVLQEGEYERVGGSKTLKVDVRVIAATHCNLEAATARGAFRPDLYYRIAGAPIRLPALRERRDDIPLLANHVLARFNAENDRALTLHRSSMALLCRCAFPGNVRELENCLRGAATMARGAAVVESDFACRNRTCFSGRLRRARLSLLPSRPPRVATAIQGDCR
jgi:Nif-specific regulatory protein